MKTSRRGYRTFEHTADIGLDVWGDSMESVFEEAAKGLFSLIADLAHVDRSDTMSVKLQAENVEELFLKWLKELLFIFDSQHLLLSHFRVNKINTNEIAAKVSGEKLNPMKHKLGREVKAVTRHQFEFARTPEGFRARVILDI